jgi:hypothetical protein
VKPITMSTVTVDVPSAVGARRATTTVGSAGTRRRAGWFHRRDAEISIARRGVPMPRTVLMMVASGAL